MDGNYSFNLGGVQMRELIQKLLDSKLSSLQIAKETGVPQSTIYRMRSKERSLDNLTLKNAELLYEFASIVLSNEDDRRRNLLVQRASIKGMLANLDMSNEESQKLEEELHDIEVNLDELNR